MTKTFHLQLNVAINSIWNRNLMRRNIRRRYRLKGFQVFLVHILMKSNLAEYEYCLIFYALYLDRNNRILKSHNFTYSVNHLYDSRILLSVYIYIYIIIIIIIF